jgi:Fe-S-cluster-containing dehydrogenase component
MATKQYRLIYDENLCIGCQACNVACRLENDVPDDIYRLQVRVSTHGTFPHLGMRFERMACVMCENPPCVSVCPTGASFQSKEGLVLIHESQCITCKYCILACPYHARFINPLKNTVEKCTFCFESRVSKELDPACVSVCVSEALHFGDMHRNDSPVARLSRQEVLAFPKAHLGTKPKVAFIPSRKGAKS